MWFSLILCTVMNHFSTGLWHVTKSGFCRTTGNVQLGVWTEKKLRNTSHSQTCTNKRSWSLLVLYCPSAPLQPSESRQNHYIWEVCSANWYDAQKFAAPAASIVQQSGPNSSPWQCLTASRTTNTSKVEWIGQRSFASSVIFTWPLAKWLSLFQASWLFWQGKFFHKQQDGGNAF